MNFIKTLIPILSLALLETSCLVAADEAPVAATRVTHIAKTKQRRGLQRTGRALKSAKTTHAPLAVDTPLTAVIKSIDSWKEMEEEPPMPPGAKSIKSAKSFKGRVHVADQEDKTDEKKIRVNYDLEGTPTNCLDCRIKIHDGSCDEIGAPYFKVWPGPYNNKKTYRSTHEGKAAGFFNLDTGYNLINNRCKLAVVYNQDKEMIGCGMLIPDGEKYDCAKNLV